MRLLDHACDECIDEAGDELAVFERLAAVRPCYTRCLSALGIYSRLFLIESLRWKYCPR